MSKRRKKSHHQGRNPRPFDKGSAIQQGTLEPLMELMGEGMMPLPKLTTDENNQLIAAIDVIGRTGAADIEIGYDDEQRAPNWWYATCKVRHPGSPSGWVTATIGGQLGPVVAAEKMARKLINGGTCTHCGRVMSLAGVPSERVMSSNLCRWSRVGKRWERGCTDLVEEGVRQEALVEAFLKAGRRG